MVIDTSSTFSAVAVKAVLPLVEKNTTNAGLTISAVLCAAGRRCIMLKITPMTVIAM